MPRRTGRGDREAGAPADEEGEDGELPDPWQAHQDEEARGDQADHGQNGDDRPQGEGQALVQPEVAAGPVAQDEAERDGEDDGHLRPALPVYSRLSGVATGLSSAQGARPWTSRPPSTSNIWPVT